MTLNKDKQIKKEKTFSMPTEVSNWIEKANSTINYQKNQIEELKKEIKELKAYKNWASNRITENDQG